MQRPNSNACSPNLLHALPASSITCHPRYHVHGVQISDAVDRQRIDDGVDRGQRAGRGGLADALEVERTVGVGGGPAQRRVSKISYIGRARVLEESKSPWNSPHATKCAHFVALGAPRSWSNALEAIAAL